MNFFNSINAKWNQGQQQQQSQSQNQNGSDSVYQSMGNDMKQVLQKSKEKRNNNGESSTPKWIQNIQQKCCPCFSAKYTILGINTSNLGIPASTGIGTR